ncbi:MAG: 2Fe-2S iron-sulfur cluster binding domain-containing protein [Verrucomicrobia bacterium]|nr:2Fe-2S iron-sulfur cluster binding domain-containing protein [Verrucomicrobiota bacterium]
MQPLIEKLQSELGGRLSLTLGLAILAALALQLFLMLAGSARRAFYERRHRRLSLDRLRLQIKEAAIRCEEAEQQKLVWNGCRKFKVTRKVRECDDVFAFYLAPHDGKPLPPYKPGQYLTFQLDLPGRDKPLVRCYSLSDSPTRADYYRVTIKKEKAPPDKPDVPPGAASCYFADVVKEGDILNAKAPTGHFYLDMEKKNPVVLIAGGVGITPMLAMANAIAASGSGREVWFFFGVRNRREHIHKEEIEKLVAANDNIRLHVCYSRPSPEEVKDRDYQHEGRVGIELLKEVLPSSNFEYYLCGNGAFMKSITDGLEAWGVPEKDVHFEAFGPATVKKKTPPPTPSETSFLAKLSVTFGKSGKTVRWDPAAANLLEFAQAQGVRIDSGCCAGSCGSCAVAIKSGAVDYAKKPDVEPEAGTCLTCVCKPKGDLVLDA